MEETPSRFAFDPDNRLLLINARPSASSADRPAISVPASSAGFDSTAGEPRRSDQTFGGRRGPCEVRRVSYRDGRPHTLIVMADLSQALREEEQAAWQRIVRVLSHEINNSLTPIKSIAHSLKRIVDRAPDFPRAGEVGQGLSLIEERSGALGRFLRAYAQLARLPKPGRNRFASPSSSTASSISKSDCRSRFSRRLMSDCRWIPISSSSS
jgi:hypothetical protein